MRDYSFGNFLQELRSRRGLTQYQLGALVGVSDKAVSKWENGTSKPQSNILYKLSKVLGVSVDELLTCKYNSFENKDKKGVFAMKKQLWNKAFDEMRERYGNPVPIEIMNRFITEHIEMKDTDMIIYFNLLSVILSNAKRKGEHIFVRGVVGASFVAHLLGATEINPLKPHYYCSECGTVLFDNSADEGWDLSRKNCSCGKTMKSDGHNIPFEAYRPQTYRNYGFDICVSPEYFSSVINIIQDYFKDCKLTREELDQNKFVTFTVLSKGFESVIAVFADEKFTYYKKLELATGITFGQVNFTENEVLTEFKRGNIDGIPEFNTNFFKDIAEVMPPESFHDLIQILGVSLGSEATLNNVKELINQGLPVHNILGYRDDVFNYVEKHMLRKGIANNGYAYKIMEDTRKGIYSKDGVSDEMREQLGDIEIEDWFINSIEKIRHLFPKAYGVTYAKLATTLMWYKIHFPKKFAEIML